MTLDELQQGVCSLYEKYPLEFGSFYTSLGIVSTVGDLAQYLMDILKKDTAMITDEERGYACVLLSNILTHVALTANNLGISLERVGEVSISVLSTKREAEQIKSGGIFNKKKNK